MNKTRRKTVNVPRSSSTPQLSSEDVDQETQPADRGWREPDDLPEPALTATVSYVLMDEVPSLSGWSLVLALAPTDRWVKPWLDDHGVSVSYERSVVFIALQDKAAKQVSRLVNSLPLLGHHAALRTMLVSALGILGPHLSGTMEYPAHSRSAMFERLYKKFQAAATRAVQAHKEIL